MKKKREMRSLVFQFLSEKWVIVDVIAIGGKIWKEIFDETLGRVKNLKGDYLWD